MWFQLSQEVLNFTSILVPKIEQSDNHLKLHKLPFFSLLHELDNLIMNGLDIQ